MNRAAKTASPLKYRAYFWLMDACLLSGVLLLCELLLPDEFKGGLVYWIVGAPIIFLIAIVVPLLIVASFLRDDYAERLWHRSVAVLTFGAATIPALFLMITWPLYLLIEPSRSSFYMAYFSFFEFIDSERSVRDTLMMTWLTFNLSFVAIFQFIRWKDSR